LESKSSLLLREHTNIRSTNSKPFKRLVHGRMQAATTQVMENKCRLASTKERGP
jgi:hypothetical protein